MHKLLEQMGVGNFNDALAKQTKEGWSVIGSHIVEKGLYSVMLYKLEPKTPLEQHLANGGKVMAVMPMDTFEPPLMQFVTCINSAGEHVVYRRTEHGYNMRDGYADNSPKDLPLIAWLKEL